MNKPAITPSPWDRAAFGIDCFEIHTPDEATLSHAAATPGHYTVKVDPLVDKALLHEYGFYYTDTLIEPVCAADRVVRYVRDDVSIVPIADVEPLLPMCVDSFLHGRFHRDFNLSNDDADLRYQRWLTQLAEQDEVLGLYFEEKLAGFIAHRKGALLLHAVDASYRGRGLAKYFWSQAMAYMAVNGADWFRSSISAGNMAALNLYASLGFRFDRVHDIYHRLTR